MPVNCGAEYPMVFLGRRTCPGVSDNLFQKLSGVDFQKYLSKAISW